jgi:hypothetical protein
VGLDFQTELVQGIMAVKGANYFSVHTPGGCLRRRSFLPCSRDQGSLSRLLAVLILVPAFVPFHLPSAWLPRGPAAKRPLKARAPRCRRLHPPASSAAALSSALMMVQLDP